MLVLLGDPSQPKNLLITKDGQNWHCEGVPLGIRGILPAPGLSLLMFDELRFYWLDLQALRMTPLQAIPRPKMKSVAIVTQGTPMAMVLTEDNGIYFTTDIRTVPLQAIFQSTWRVDLINEVKAGKGGVFLFLGTFYDPVSKQYYGALAFNVAANTWLGVAATAGYQECLFFDGTVAACRENLSPRAPVVMISTKTNQVMGKVSASKLMLHTTDQGLNHLITVEGGCQGACKTPSLVTTDGGRTWVSGSPGVVDFPVTALAYDPVFKKYFLGNAYRYSWVSQNFEKTVSQPYSDQFQLAGGDYSTAVFETAIQVPVSAVASGTPTLQKVVSTGSTSKQEVVAAVVAGVVALGLLWVLFGPKKTEFVQVPSYYTSYSS